MHKAILASIFIVCIFPGPSFPSPFTRGIETGGGIAFPEYISLPYGSLSYNKLTNSGFYEIGLEFGYRQVRSNGLPETARLQGFSFAYLLKSGGDVFYIGPCVGILSCYHNRVVTIESNGGIPPWDQSFDTEKRDAYGLLGCKAVLFFHGNSPIAFKIQSRLLFGYYQEDMLGDRVPYMYTVYNYNSTSGVNVFISVGAGLLFGF